jgi:indole-3-acetate monooxygenase
VRVAGQVQILHGRAPEHCIAAALAWRLQPVSTSDICLCNYLFDTRSSAPVCSPARGEPLATTDIHHDLFASVRELEPLIRAHQASADQLGYMPAEVIDAFHERDLFRILLPSELGGGGVDLLTAMLLVEDVSAIDGSMGWLFEIGIGGLVRLGFLPKAQARQLANEPRAFVAGTFPPLGRATVVPGGFRVSGRWPFASGIHHARWVAAGCTVYEGDAPRPTPQGGPEVVHVFMPTSALTILDTWHVGGMRGTGSTDHTAHDVFVPDELATFPADRHFACSAPILRTLDTTLGTTFGFVAFGIARGAIEGLVKLASTETSLHSDGNALRERISTHYELAKAEAMLEASRSSLIDAVRGVEEAAIRGAPVELPERARACAGHKCMLAKPRWTSSTGCIAQPEPRRCSSQRRSNVDCAMCTRWSSKSGCNERRWRMLGGSDLAWPRVAGPSSQPIGHSPCTNATPRGLYDAVGYAPLNRTCDLSTSNSQPGADGSKPCSISQRAASFTHGLRQRRQVGAASAANFENTLSAPNGARRAMLRSATSLSNDMLDTCSSEPPSPAPLMTDCQD